MFTDLEKMHMGETDRSTYVRLATQTKASTNDTSMKKVTKVVYDLVDNLSENMAPRRSSDTILSND